MPRILIHPDSTREVVEEATETPQVGAMPRTADGVPIGGDGVPIQVTEPESAEAPTGTRRSRRAATNEGEPAPHTEG